MLKVICPLDGTVHHADVAFAGKMLRCAKCGGPVQIGSSIVNPRSQVATVGEVEVSNPVKKSNQRNQSNHIGRSPVVKASLVCGACILLMCLWLIPKLNETPVNSSTLSLPIAKSPYEATAVQSTPSIAAAAASSGAVMGRAATAPWKVIGPDVTLSRRLSTGTRILPDRETNGRGVITIDNSGGQDAAVKIVSTSDGALIWYVFIQRGTSLNFKKVDLGRYTVLFATGTDWDAKSLRFTRDRDFFEFGESLPIEETESAKGRMISNPTITLYPTPGGTVQRKPIPERVFELK